MKDFNNISCCMRKKPSLLQNIYDGAILNSILFFSYISAYMTGMHSLCLSSFILFMLISSSVLVNYRLLISEVEYKKHLVEDELLRLINTCNNNVTDLLPDSNSDDSDVSNESSDCDDMPPLISTSEIRYDKPEIIRAKFSDYNTIIHWPNQIYSQNIPVFREILEASQNNTNNLD